MSKVKTVLIGIAIAISVFGVIGCICSDDYKYEVINAHTENEAYRAFCSEGLIDGNHLYTINKADSNEDGLCTAYVLTVEHGSYEDHYYYYVEDFA